jgi:hypothetical protein
MAAKIVRKVGERCGLYSMEELAEGEDPQATGVFR